MFLPFKPEACFMFFLSTVPTRPFLTDRNSAWREMKIMCPITYNQVINWWSQVGAVVYTLMYKPPSCRQIC